MNSITNSPHPLECYTYSLLGYNLVSTLIITFRAMSPNHLWHYHPVPAWGFRSKVHLSYFTGWDITSSWDVRRDSMLPAGVTWAFWFRLLSVRVDLRISCCHYHKWLTTRNGTFIILLISVNVFFMFCSSHFITFDRVNSFVDWANESNLNEGKTNAVLSNLPCLCLW